MKTHLFIIVIAALSFMWILGPLKSGSRTTAQVKKHPQEYMVQVSVWNYTETGSLKSRMSAKSWSYFPEINASKLLAPHMTLYKPDNTIWDITAEEGTINQPSVGAIEEIMLSKSVILERPATENAFPILVKTEALNYNPKTQFAETEQLITMIKPDLKIVGTGMRAFLDRNAVELLHNVKTYYNAHSK